MRKTTVIISPTQIRAVYEWKAFLSRWPTKILKANRTNLYVELLSGHKIYFKSKTAGRSELVGLCADIVSVDEFVMPQEERSDKE